MTKYAEDLSQKLYPHQDDSQLERMFKLLREAFILGWASRATATDDLLNLMLNESEEVISDDVWIFVSKIKRAMTVADGLSEEEMIAMEKETREGES